MSTLWTTLYRAAQANDTYSAAIALAESGLPVFPVRQTKKPYTRHGFQDASRDVRQVETWWRQWPDAMLGIPTGDVSGLVVVDVDSKNERNGFVNLSKLGLPLTFTTSSQSGGQHFYYAYPNRKVRCSVDKVAVGIDIRGDGGYAIFPPSIGKVGQYSLDLPACLEPFPEGIDETEILEQLEILEHIEKVELSEKPEAISNIKHIFSDIGELSVQAVIALTLPKDKGQRNAKILDLARGLKFEARLQNATDAQLLPTVREWHSLALENIETKSFEETWYDFLQAWTRAKLPLMIDVLEWAVEEAKRNPVPVPSWIIDDDTKLMFGACFYIAQKTNGEFFFSGRSNEKYLGMDAVTGWRRLKLLESKGVIKQIKKGQNLKASRYKWIGPPAIDAGSSRIESGEVKP